MMLYVTDCDLWSGVCKFDYGYMIIQDCTCQDVLYNVLSGTTLCAELPS